MSASWLLSDMGGSGVTALWNSKGGGMRILLSASKEGMKLSGGITPVVYRGVVGRKLAARIFSYGELGRVLEGTGTGEGDKRCLEGGRVCPLRMLRGWTFSEG